MSNSLAAVHPELVAEWSEKNLPLTPDSITFGSNKKVWWKGACGHEWQTSVKARSNGEKCPICSGARVIAGINDLATLEPLLEKQWSKKNKIKPTEVSIGSHKKVIWRCEKGHEWEVAVKSRTINKTGCPYCSHNKVLAGFNDLATLLPDIAAEWSDRNYPLLPTQVTVFANRKAWWKCKDCGREWNTLISTRSGGSKCPYCSGYIFSKGFNDLQTTHPEIASEWSEKNLPLKPDEVNAKSRKNVWWKCRKCGNEWKSVVNARVKGTVCPVCAEREVLAGYNDLATTDSQLLSEWDYEQNKLKPTEVSRTSAKRAWWKCRHGHSWSMKINERTILNKGCRICEQEYLSLFPALAVSYYSNKKGLKAELGSDRLLGVPLETYIPSEKLAIESGSADENIEIMKAYMCEQRGIRLIKLPMKGTELDYADSLKRAFQNVHELQDNEVAEVFTAMNPDQRLFFAKFETPSFVNQRLIGLTHRGEYPDEELNHALINSMFTMFYIEASGFGRGLGVLDVNKDNIENCYMLNPDLVDANDRQRILQSFNSVKARKIMKVEDELKDEDRIAFEHTVLQSFGIDDYFDKIKSSLLSMQATRKTVKEL